MAVPLAGARSDQCVPFHKQWSGAQGKMIQAPVRLLEGADASPRKVRPQGRHADRTDPICFRHAEGPTSRNIRRSGYPVQSAKRTWQLGDSFEVASPRELLQAKNHGKRDALLCRGGIAGHEDLYSGPPRAFIGADAPPSIETRRFNERRNLQRHEQCGTSSSSGCDSVSELLSARTCESSLSTRGSSYSAPSVRASHGQGKVQSCWASKGSSYSAPAGKASSMVSPGRSYNGGEQPSGMADVFSFHYYQPA